MLTKVSKEEVMKIAIDLLSNDKKGDISVLDAALEAYYIWFNGPVVFKDIKDIEQFLISEGWDYRTD